MKAKYVIVALMLFWGLLGGVDREFAGGGRPPSALVNGMVNVVSGTFVDNATDLAVGGTHRLVLSRQYSSAKRRFNDGYLWKSWRFNHHPFSSNQIFSKSGSGNRNELRVPCFHGIDGRFICSRNESSKDISFSLDPESLPHCSGGYPFAQVNLKNSRGVISRDTQEFLLTHGSGERQLWKPSENGHQLSEIVSPDGQNIHYSYTSEERERPCLDVIQDESNQIAFSLRDSRSGTSKILTACASNGEWVKYKAKYFKAPYFFNRAKALLLYEVSGNCVPKTKYDYYMDERLGAKLRRRTRPGGRCVEVEYYRKNRPRPGPGPREVRESDPDFNRVSQLEEPAGIAGERVVTHKFLYTHNCTTVLDAYDNPTDYRYDKHGRLTQINRYLNGVYSYEKYFWGGERTDSEGQLLSRCQYNADDQKLRSLSYTYDERGNAVKETQTGDLSGSGDLDQTYSIYRSYSSDGFNLLLEESEDNGKGVQQKFYPESNRLASEFTLDNGRVVHRRFFSYDASGNCVSKIEDDGNRDQSDNLSNVTCRLIERLSYDVNGYKTGIQRLYLDLSSGAEVQLLREEFVNDYRGLVQCQALFDADDVLKYRLDFSYDKCQRMVMKVDSRGPVEEYSYDEMNHLVSQRTQGSLKTRQYDRMNRVILESSGKGQVSRTEFDHMGRPKRTIDQNSCITKRIFDQLGRCTHEFGHWTPSQERPLTRFAYDEFGNQTLQVDAQGGATRLTYNARNQVAHAIHPGGVEESWVYNLDGTLAKHYLTNGTSLLFTYDALGRVLEEKVLDRDGVEQRSRLMCYKGERLIEEVDGCGRRKEYAYDDAGRLVWEREAGRVIRYRYDSSSRRTHRITEAGTTVQVFDLFSRVIEERTEDSEGIILTRVSYAYDLAGNRTHVTHYHDAGIEVTETVYNDLGEPTCTIDGSGNETHTIYERDLVDARNQRLLRVTTVDSIGRAMMKLHDAYGNCVEEEIRDWAGEVLSHASHNYDRCGRLVRTVHSVVLNGEKLGCYESSRNYDLAGRVSEISSEGRTTSYLYDQYGQVLRKTLPDGLSLQYTYDSCCRVSRLQSSDRSIDYSYEYDAYDRPISVEDRVQWLNASRNYDCFGNVTEELLANGLELQHCYDSSGRKTYSQLPDGSGVSYDWRSDGLGAVRRISTEGECLYQHQYQSRALDGCLRQCQLPGSAGTLCLERDEQGRLVSIESTGFTERLLGYDAVGRLRGSCTQDSRGTFERELRYSDLDHMLAEQGSVAHQYTVDSLHNIRSKDDDEFSISDQNKIEGLGRQYDARGNLIEVQGTHLVYDALDRLISMKRESELQTFLYDSDNRRVASRSYQQRDGQWFEVDYRRYLYAGQNEIGCADALGELKQFRCLGVGIGAEIGATVAIETGGEVYVPISNHRGDICCLLDLDGRPQESYRYSAYGEELEPPAAPISPWRYASKRVEANGWVYFGRRYYAPEDGRWISPDPSGESDGPNLYAYLSSSPFSGVDHYGLWRVGFQQVSDFCVSFADFVGKQPGLSFTIGYTPNTYYRPASKTYEIKSPQFEDSPYVVMITNGMGTCLDGAYRMAQSISVQFGDASVYHTHNQTYTLLGDFIAWVMRPIFGGAAVREKVGAWREVIRAFRENGRAAMIFEHAHSEGARVVAAALKLMTAAERDMIWVCTYGAAEFIRSEEAFTVTNYIDARDPIPYFACMGTMRRLVKGLPTPEYDIRIVGGELPKSWSIADVWGGFSLNKHYFEGEEYQKCVKNARELIEFHFRQQDC